MSYNFLFYSQQNWNLYTFSLSTDIHAYCDFLIPQALFSLV